MKTTPGTEDVKSSPHELQRKLSNRHLQLSPLVAVSVLACLWDREKPSPWQALQF